ncbi:MAG: agmatinase family protein [Synergistales bacterium]|nr:agmatinase family protein [Synergistales bacterium]
MDQQTLPAYAGIPTFLRAPQAEQSELSEGSVAVVGVPFDTTCASRPGARFGPRGIREGTLHFMHQIGALTTDRKEMVDIRTGERFAYPYRDILFDTGDVPLYPSDVEATAEAVEEAVYGIARKGAFPVILGGDHYITYPCFCGYARAVEERDDKERMGYLHIDSHLDLTDRTEAWGDHYHGSLARRVAETDYLEVADMAWVGIGGSFQTAERWEFIQQHGLSIYTSRDIEDTGVDGVIEKAFREDLSRCSTVYVTIDIDIVDHAFAPGTGSYVFGGISSSRFLQMMEALSRQPRIGAIDLVEVAPPLDPTGCTSRLAATGLISFLRPRIFDMVK